MKYIEVIANEGSMETVVSIASHCKVADIRSFKEDETGLKCLRILVADDKLQNLMDKLEGALSEEADTRITVLAVETYLPKSSHRENKQESKAVASRHALYNEVARNANLDANFVLLVCLSTLVAAIGMLQDNIAVIIGAMVIAPLLGPNLALGLGTALGDGYLMLRAFRSLLVGVIIAVALSFLLGYGWPGQPMSHELMSRTEPSLESVVLALASGAAAALSITTGLSSVLVGVMVAVALLPPASTIGIMLSYSEWQAAKGALLLLGINIASVNLTCNLVFLFKGISPRTWQEKHSARRSTMVYVGVWTAMLIMLTWFVITKPVVVT